MNIKNSGKCIAVIILLGLTLGSINYAAHMTKTVSQLKADSLKFQDQLLETQQYLSEVSDNYSPLQDQINGQGRQYTGNPFSTQLWPGQLQSENITGMHWYSLYNGALVNVTDNVLGLGAGEGDYTTWTHVWTRDYGAGAPFLLNVLVDNSGTVYAEDLSDELYVKTYGGAETNVASYHFAMHEIPVNDPMSATGKYMLGTPLYSTEFEVWKDGVQTFSRDVQLDEEDAIELGVLCVSPNGKFIAIVTAVAGYSWQIVMLYEGS